MKCPIVEQGKIVGFYLKETPAETAAGKRVFARVQLGPGISRADVERMRAKWPLSGRRRKKPNQRINSIKKAVLQEARLDLQRVLKLKSLRPRSKERTDQRWLTQINALLNYQILGLTRPFWNRTRKELGDIVAGQQGKGSHHIRERILKQERQWVQSRLFLSSQQGRYSKGLEKLKDEGTLLFIREVLAEKKEKVDSVTLARAISAYWEREGINDGANPEAVQKTISSSAALAFLKKQGLRWKDLRKGLYKDGHERVDVVEFRQKEFLPAIQAFKEQKLDFYLVPTAGNGSAELRCRIPATLDPAKRPVVEVYQDESTFFANEGRTHGWISDEWYPLHPKGEGSSINVSDFVTRAGRLRAPQSIAKERLPTYGLEEGMRKDAYQAAFFLECGGDVWWNGELLAKQIELVAIPLFDLAFPGCQAVFIFDNSTLHSAFAPSALRANKIQLASGGKQPFMRTTINPYTNEEQPMVLPNGQQKGARVVLQERGLWNANLVLQCKNPEKPESYNSNCLNGCRKCAKGILAMEPDFLAQRSRLEEIIEGAGHRCLFLPKYHPEINPIEYVWGAAKNYARRNCEYSLPALRQMIPRALGPEGVPDELVFKFFERVDRIHEAYIAGEHYGTAAFKERVYKSHRRVSNVLL
jgi:hypothetical protein